MAEATDTPTSFSRPHTLRGALEMPGDKSLSHRALLFSALASGRTEVVGLGKGGDVRATAAALAQLGVTLDWTDRSVVVHGLPLAQWRSPTTQLDCGNSGTTMRLLTGLLAARPGLEATLVGDASLSRRPMARVAEPLRRMGAQITLSPQGTAPVEIRGQALHGASHTLAAASAQVKTALLLAGLHATGQTRIREPGQSRDHSERMLAAMGAELRSEDGTLCLQPGSLRGLERIEVPGDPSAAAFFAVAAVLHPRADLTIDGLCLNPTRIGFVRVLERMGARILTGVQRTVAGEPVGRLHALTSVLRATRIDAAEVPGCIDELPVLALAAACARGTSVFSGIGELRVKESDRLAETAALLRLLGIDVRDSADRLEIVGKEQSSRLCGGLYVAGLDHRMAMTAAIAGTIGGAAVQVQGMDAVASSFPGFCAVLEGLGRGD